MVKKRRDYVTVPLFTETDKAWLAGLIDGGGSINISTQKDEHHTFSKSHYALNLEISEKHLPTLEKVKAMCGMGSVTEHKDKRKHRPYWLWMVRSNQALYILQIVYPYLFTKRENAKTAIAFQRRRYENRGQWNHNAPMREIRVSEDEGFFQTLRAINFESVGNRN